MSAAELKEIIDAGNVITAGRYYSIAATTIFFYDFLLTLADEIKYAWQGRKTWVFLIFLAVLANGISVLVAIRCDKTAFLEVLATVETTFLAQVVLTLRIYAVTKKNRMITSCFGIIMTVQLVVGLILTTYAATRGAEPVIPIPLPVYTTCVFKTQGLLKYEISFTAISLLYDFLAFSLIIYLVVRSNVNKIPIPNLLRTIAKDATTYFLVIFTSHLVLVMFLAFANSSIQLLPGDGNAVYLPVMISRLMISLKKAATSTERGWNFGEPATHATMKFAERRSVLTKSDDMRLDTFTSTHEGTQSQE